MSHTPSSSDNALADDLGRFIQAQRNVYAVALAEIRAGRKQSHWMWFIFPQLAGLGSSDLARFYAIRNREEAVRYFDHPVLGTRLIEITTALLALDGLTVLEIFGAPDDLKLCSCCTLFSSISSGPSVFDAVLSKYFAGQPDRITLSLLG